MPRPYLILTLIFLAFCVKVSAQSDRLEPAVITSRSCQSADEFCRQVNVRKATKFDGEITVKPTSKLANLRDLEIGYGGRSVLSVAVDIKNSSQTIIRSHITHEWYGGIPPLTDFLVSAKPKKAKEAQRRYAPAYQVGNLGTVQPETVWKPRESKTFDIRLNWFGTGSQPSEPLIDPKKIGKYSVKFILFFQVENRTFYIETKEFDLVVK